MNKRTMLALASVVAIALAAPALAAPRTLSVGTQTNETGFLAPALIDFANRVKELSNDELELQIFWSAQLGSAAQMNQSLAAGALDFQSNVVELLSAFEPGFGVMSMPLVFRDRNHFAKFLGSDIFDGMLANLESKGIIFPQRADFKDPETAQHWIRPWDRGLISNRPIFTPDDLKGFKLRMYESEIPLKSWQQLGANVQVIPWPDVYTSIATGIVDGLTGTVVDNYDMKHFENAHYWTNVHEYFQMQVPYMSKITWDSLSPEHQKVIVQALHDSGPLNRSEMDKADAEARQKSQEDFGVSFIDPPSAPWIAKMAPAHADFEARGLIEKGLIAKIQAIK